MTSFRPVHRDGFSIDLPPQWTEVTDARGSLFAASEPEDNFAASVVITAETPPRAMSFDEWQESTEQGLEDQLAGYQLLDFIPVALGNLQAARRTGIHSAFGTPVTMFQFVTAQDHIGWTVTISTPDWKFPRMQSDLERIGNSFRIEDKL